MIRFLRDEVTSSMPAHWRYTALCSAGESKALNHEDHLISRRTALWVPALPLAMQARGTSAAAGPAATQPPTETPAARVVTHTHLKSQPGRLAQLERYVRANWFAMDERAVQRGLFVHYEWLDSGSDEGPWNAIVVVTYNDEKGFEGIRERWAEIQSAHQEVRPDGLGMKDLGRVLETRNLLERAPFALKRASITPGR